MGMQIFQGLEGYLDICGGVDADDAQSWGYISDWSIHSL